MNNIATLQPQQNSMAKIDRHELISVLQNSLYVGAKPESVMMVLDYCAASGFDPMQKPVHIVPMNTKNPVTGSYEWRDVIMPGIGMYRIQADRSGTLAGISEPVFGNMIQQTFNDKNGNQVSMEYPEYCKVTIKKIVGSHIVEFTAQEFWIENYATAGKCDAPNAMWKKRPRGQLAKCAEAQALRKAFPEIGSQPTAEEMEGKVIDSYVESEQTTIEAKPELPTWPDDKFQKKIDSGLLELIASGQRTADEIINTLLTKGQLTEEQIQTIRGAENANS